MPGRIPQYDAQVAAQADRRVISTPVLNQDVGEGDALRAVGGAIDAGVELAVKLETANQDRQITTADRVAREKLDRLKFDLENTSPDVADEDLKKRYQERLRKKSNVSEFHRFWVKNDSLICCRNGSEVSCW